MKKTIIILIAMLGGAVHAQTPDTVSFHQLDDIYYNVWYDTCDCYQKGVDAIPMNITVRILDSSTIATIPYDVSHPMMVKGVVMMEAINFRFIYHWFYDDHLPEYALIYQYDAILDTMILLDSARWDTITPKVLGLPIRADRPDSIFYCHAFPVYFDSPILVDSTFYVGGTHYSNNGHNVTWMHRPVEYEGVCFDRICRGCTPNQPKYYDDSTGWHTNSAAPITLFGGFIPIVEKNNLEGTPDDSQKGSVSGSGRYPTFSEPVLTAIPNPEYRFVNWNDGDTSNPRIVHLTQDTTFTAHFESNRQYSVHAVANDNRRGRVDGGGTYYVGDTATLTVTPYDPYLFARWDDGDTTSPRQIVVVGDTALTAIFLGPDDTTGIARVAKPAVLFTLTPNPTTGKVTVTVGHTPQSGTHSSVSKADSSPNLGEQLILTLRDAAGHEVLRKELSTFNSQLSTTLDLSSLPAGAYFVTLTTPTASSTQRLVVK